MKKSMDRAKKILERLHLAASDMRSGEQMKSIPPQIVKKLDPFIKGIEGDKSLVQVIVTSGLKKLISPKQDIRLHMAKFAGGYSARSLDTKITTPFFNKHFPKYANKETAFLTKATRADIIWNKKDGQKLPLRSKHLVTNFLELINDIQNQTINIELCIIYIIANLQLLTQKQQKYYKDIIKASDVVGVININTVIEMLSNHFNSKLSSRLPVIAIHAIYQQMIHTINRYKDKKLLPLNVHTSADKHSYGDIEITNPDGTPFEVVEIKHNIAIDSNLIVDIAKKSAAVSIQKYYVLTTYPDSFANDTEASQVNLLAKKIKKETGMEIIANGIIQSIKYYLRFIEDYNEYLKSYTNALVDDASRSTEIKTVHIKAWQQILKNAEIVAS